MDETKPHIAFSLTTGSVSNALTRLGVLGAGSNMDRTGALTGWPDEDAWLGYTAAASSWVHGLLSDAQRKTINQDIEALESRLNTWLNATTNAGADHSNDIDTLRALRADIRAAETVVCGEGSHAAFPYFVRWFMLEFAGLAALAERGGASEAEQLSSVQMWWRCRDYLQRAFISAYAYRTGKLVCRYTGALGDRLFIYDEQIHRPLTIDVAAGGQDEFELRRVLEYLSSVAARDYVDAIRLGDGAKILADAHAAISLTERSSIRSDELVDPVDFWSNLQTGLTSEIEGRRQACGSALARLVLAASKPALAAGTAPAVVPSGADAEERANPPWYTVIQTVVPGAIGMIPVVGSLVSSVYSLYFTFLGDVLFKEPNPLEELEKKLTALIEDKIAELDANNIRNKLNGLDEAMRLLTRDHYQKRKPLTQQEEQEFTSRALTILTDFIIFQPSLTNPASGSYYKVAPYYGRFFIAFLYAMELAKSMKVLTVDFDALKLDLYKTTNRFVPDAIYGISAERKRRVYLKTTSKGCKADEKNMFDERTNTFFSGNLANTVGWAVHSCKEACTEAAGMASAIQLMRTITREMDFAILSDKTNVYAGGPFAPNTIYSTYSNAIWYLNGQCWAGYQHLKNNNIQHLVSADTAEFSDTTEQQRGYNETTPAFPKPGNIYLIP